MPSAVTPDAFLDYSPTGSRVLKVDANVIAYFGDYFHAFCQGMRNAVELTVAPVSPFRKDPSNIASSRNRY